jgi:hypothetical protein
MKYLILRPTPAFISSRGEEVPVTGRKGELLRILLLMRGKMLSKADIAAEMPSRRASKQRERGRPVAATTIEGYAGQLRDVIGDDGIETGRDTYRATALPDDVDAFVFARSVEELGVMQYWSVDDATETLVSRLDGLLQLKGMWQANPAQDHFESQNFPELCEAYVEFADCYRRLRFAIVYAYLRRATPRDIRAAITYLQAMSAHLGSDTDPEAWHLLLRAYGSVPSYQRDVPLVLNTIRSYYGGEVPDDMLTVCERVMARDPALLFGAESLRPRGGTSAPMSAVASAEPGPDVSALVELSKEIGLSIEGSTLRLQGSGSEPLACIDQTVRTLYFYGILASKWVEVSAVRHRFDELLTRLDDEGGEVKFLLIDPESESYERFRAVREGNEGLSSLPHLLRLSKQHSSFEVRLYDALPSFRVVIIDRDVMTVSPYLLAAEDYLRGRYGWEAPHAAFDPFAPWSFAKGFEVLFLEQWRKARPIEELDVSRYTAQDGDR